MEGNLLTNADIYIFKCHDLKDGPINIQISKQISWYLQQTLQMTTIVSCLSFFWISNQFTHKCRQNPWLGWVPENPVLLHHITQWMNFFLNNNWYIIVECLKPFLSVLFLLQFLRKSNMYMHCAPSLYTNMVFTLCIDKTVVKWSCTTSILSLYSRIHEIFFKVKSQCHGMLVKSCQIILTFDRYLRTTVVEQCNTFIRWSCGLEISWD